MLGHKGDFVHKSTGNSLLDFFSRSGSLYKKQKHYHGNNHSIIDLFKPAWEQDEYQALQLAMWLRDRRSGSGNRSGFRNIMSFIAQLAPEWIKSNIHFVPQVGRWDDMISFIDTPCENEAIAYWANAIANKDALAAKWCPREKKNKIVYHKLRKHLKLSPPEFRKMIVKATNVVENKMCDNKWGEINYNNVPSVAMARSVNAFAKHDHMRFEQWKSSLSNPESGNKINASVLFPHDCLRTLRAELGIGTGYNTWSLSKREKAETYSDSLVANAQFSALPNFMDKTNAKIIAVCDFSGSMLDSVSPESNIMRIDVSMSLGLYCSDRIGEKNPFYRKFIPFSDDSRLVDWSGESFSVAAQKYNDNFCGSTNIGAALNQILDSAKLMCATKEQMPTHLLIISDMQFDPINIGSQKTAITDCIDKWVSSGYNRPKIVYWNLAGYKNSPDRFDSKDIALVSGFSPSLLKAILEGEDFSPMAIMQRAICGYEIVRPEGYVKHVNISVPTASKNYEEYEICSVCHGTGFAENDSCRFCMGTGEINLK